MKKWKFFLKKALYCFIPVGSKLVDKDYGEALSTHLTVGAAKVDIIFMKGKPHLSSH